MTSRISSLHNKRIKEVRRLQRGKERRRLGRTILEGPNLLSAATAAGVTPKAVFITEGDDVPSLDAEVFVVSDAVMDVIAPTASPRGPIAVIPIPHPSPLEAKRTVVLWEVSTPGNSGTLIRTAAALGWNVARHRGADPWSPKVLRAGAGAHFAVSLAEVESIDELVWAGLAPVAMVSRGGLSPEDVLVTAPVALLVGGEAAGLPRTVVDASAAVLTIPMVGGDSLNAAVAGSIAMYALSKRS